MNVISWMTALFFACNIGASGTAAAMGPVYGSGAIRKRWMALGLVALAAFIGAVFGGGHVVDTIRDGIIPAHLVTVKMTVIIVAAAVLTLFGANRLGIPLSTSEVTVGSLIGVGLAAHALHLHKVLLLAAVWLVLPFLSCVLSFALGRLLRPLEDRLAQSHSHRGPARLISAFLIASGCYQAVSAGMNNAANAVGPLIAAGVSSVHTGLFWAGLCMGMGALWLGGRVLETNAKQITELSLLQGSVAACVSGTLVIAASVFGLPVPLTQASTMALFGIGSAQTGRQLWQRHIVRRILMVWAISPIASLVLSYLLVEVVVRADLYTATAVFSALAVAAGVIRLLSSRRRLSGDLSPVQSGDRPDAQSDATV
ncbi:MAG: inorganic phosphate transporter family protein [Alicyclobacillus sp.]|nr:inorganic phosphate transporter family protein [Alicyclobacillus sp.]